MYYWITCYHSRSLIVVFSKRYSPFPFTFPPLPRPSMHFSEFIVHKFDLETTSRLDFPESTILYKSEQPTVKLFSDTPRITCTRALLVVVVSFPMSPD